MATEPGQADAKHTRRLPPWIKKRLSATGTADRVRRMLDGLGLQTVCENAHCPNQAECYARSTATFLILGNRCTRNCRYCAVDSAAPIGPPDPAEPQTVAEASARLGLRHVVITSVTRDDLADGGAGHFAETIRAVRRRLGEAIVEVLTPDFQGNVASVDTVLAAGPDIFNHNLETVERLFPRVRPQADYRRSLEVLAYVRQTRADHRPKPYTKSGLMVGLGESDEEVAGAMADLRSAGCDVLTIGQYLAPSTAHAPVARFVEPARFDRWEAQARQLGFAAAACGPFVRSSYHAQSLFESLDA